MNTTVLTLKELGKKAARLKGNRNINDNKVKMYATDFATSVEQILPATICEATKAVEQGLEVVDFETGETITGEALKDYVVIMDGQHRYQAWCDLRANKVKVKSKGEDGKNHNIPLEYDKEFKVAYYDSDVPIFNALTSMNRCVTAWSASDLAKCVTELVANPLPMVKAIAELIDKGIVFSTACQWLTLAKKPNIGKAAYDDYIKGNGSTALENTTQLDNGKMLFKAAEEARLDYKLFLSPRNFIGWIIGKVRVDGQVDNDLVAKMCKFITERSADLKVSLMEKTVADKLSKWDELWDNM